MQFEIRYLIEYAYDADVANNRNALRVKPQDAGGQRCPEFSVQVTPDARLQRHTDRFGTEVVEFEVARPHRRLAIDVRARTATSAPPEPPQASWEGVRALSYRQAAGEFLLPGAEAASDRLPEALVAASGAAPSPLATLELLMGLIAERFRYRRGVTDVHSGVAELLGAGAGVCQDFVHLALGLLRRHGLAARYVSGYLFTGRAEHGETVGVDPHAWLELLLPRSDGEPVWVGADPTNRMLAGERHVKIGHGRRYSDVPPITGMYRGPANARLESLVTMTSLEREDPTSAAPA